MLSLVIPCYNEERTLRNCVEKCLKLKEYNIDLELIVVDDCSLDNSLQIAYQLRDEYEDVIVLQNSVNMGKGAALRKGFLAAHGDYVGIQDADMEYDPIDYIDLLKPLEDNQADVVYGSRYLRQDTRRVLYFWHTWMNRSLTFVSNMFTNLDITDMETCYKLFRRDIIQKIAPMLKEDRFGFEPEVTTIVSRLNLRVFECAIHYSPRTYEEGKKIGWKDGVRALYCLFHYGAPYAPLPMQLLIYFFIGLISAVVNLTSFAFCLYVDLPLNLSIVSTFILAAIVNYFLCIAILFRHKARWAAKSEVFFYIFTIMIMCLFDFVITNGLICIGISEMSSRIISTIFGFIGNFVLRKYLVF